MKLERTELAGCSVRQGPAVRHSAAGGAEEEGAGGGGRGREVTEIQFSVCTNCGGNEWCCAIFTFT